MKKLFFFLIFSFFYSVSFAQTKHPDNNFPFIENSTDTIFLKFIQSFKCISKKGDDIVSLFRAIKIQAQNKGGNCFKYKSFNKDSAGIMTLCLDTYYADEPLLFANLNNHEKNTIYIISDGDFSNKTYTFSINGEKKIIMSGTYFKYEIKKGQKVEINKGGFIGTTAVINWEENKPTKFLTLSGFGFSDNPTNNGPFPNSNTGASVSFTAGKIKSVESSIGYLLTRILTQSEGK